MFKQHGPAPVPAADLAAALAPFGQSRMLPRAAYVDPAVFEWEQRNIFSGWTCVGNAGDLAAVGAQKAVGTGPNAILLVRAEDDTVRAFANTCRHRGHELLACGATAKGRSIVCPYHSWSYRLDGRLRNAPGFRDVDGFKPDEFGLAELRLANWHGWLFVDASGEDLEFSEHVAGLADVVDPYHAEDLTAASRVIAHESVYDEVVLRLSATARATTIGPLISASQRDRVLDLLAGASARAEIVAGGNTSNRDGFFLEPTVIAGLRQDDALVQTEIFGPVVTVQPFRDDDEALTMANGVEQASPRACGLVRIRAQCVSCVTWISAVSVNAHAPMASELPHGGFGPRATARISLVRLRLLKPRHACRPRPRSAVG